MNLSSIAQSPVSLFAAVAAAHALGVMSPGPDLAVVVRQTLAHGRRAGVGTALGIACGLAFHLAYSLFGLSWALHRYPDLLDMLRDAGGLLLLYLGWNAIWARPSSGTEDANPDPVLRSAGTDFGIGLATNVLNVKAMLFFVALGSAIAAAAAPAGLRLALGAWMIVGTGAWFAGVAWTLGHPRVRARLLMRRHWLDRAMGAILIVLGVAMLVAALRR